MRIFFESSTGYCGEDGCEALEVDDNLTPEQLDDYAYELAVANAESYGRYECGCGEEHCDSCKEPVNIESSWSIFNAEKHDQWKPGGGSWF